MRFHEFNLLENAQFTVSVPTSTRSRDVADMQKALVGLGIPLPRFGIDGIIGWETEGAIKQFQTSMKQAATGKPDASMIAALNSQLAARPEDASKLTKSTDAEVKPKRPEVDVSVIQDPDFNTKLEKIASQLGIESSVLVAIMKHESGMNPAAVNKLGSGATGLIQFMPDTARGLGTSVEELRTMSAVDQLDYVYKYYKRLGARPGSTLGDMYMLTFLPLYAYRDENTVVGELGGGLLPGTRKLTKNAIYKQNPSFDHNRDGVFTIADVKRSVEKFA